MTVYLLERNEFYGETFTMGVFTSEEKAIEFRDKTIEKGHGYYEEDNFEITEVETDPEWL